MAILLREADVEKLVTMDMAIETIEEVFRLADGYVFPTVNYMSAIEIPLSVLEAMATNLPVATMAFGGIPDLFEDGGGLFICHSEDEFIRKSHMMLEKPEPATRDLVINLSWDQVAAEIVEKIETELA